MAANVIAYFTSKAPWIMAKLMADFSLSVIESAAILGNLGHESGGFKSLQEKKPVVAGAAGGWGWGQWTGPRRVAFMAYAKRNGLDPSSDQANYGWLFVELTTTEKAAIAALKKAPNDLYAKVVAFEKAFERAGVKHYDSRVVWAQRALAAYNAGGAKAPQPAPTPTPTKPKPTVPGPVKVGTGAAWLALATTSLKWALIAAAAAGVAYVGYKLYKKWKPDAEGEAKGSL